MRLAAGVIAFTAFLSLSIPALAKQEVLGDGTSVDVTFFKQMNDRDGNFLALAYKSKVSDSDASKLAQEVSKVWNVLRMDLYAKGLERGTIKALPQDGGKSKEFEFKKEGENNWSCSDKKVHTGAPEENLVAQALVLNSQGKPDLAIEKLNSALRLNSSFTPAYRAKSIVYLAQRNWKDCIDACSKEIELAPKSAEAFGNRGAAHLAVKSYESALEDFNHAIALKSDDAQFYSNRAAVLKLLGKSEQALEDCNKALALDSGNFRTYVNRSSVFLDLKQFENAEADATKAIELNPGYSTSYTNRGEALFMLGRYGEAATALSKSIETPPTLPEAYFYLAKTYEKLGKNELAVSNMSKAKELGYKVK